jgi:hypothetical protein
MGIQKITTKKKYWNITDEQVMEKTGKKISEWIKIPDKFKVEKNSNNVVAHLQTEYAVPRYWARPLITHYLKSKAWFFSDIYSDNNDENV